MDQLSRAQAELREMVTLAAGTSVVHRLHPLCKLFVTVTYIFIVVSFHKYDLSWLIVMILYPVILFQLAGRPVHVCFYKLRVVLPLVCAVGLANPFFDHVPLAQIGNLVITGGVISMITLMLKGCLALMASFLLVATTPVDALCGALRRSLHARQNALVGGDERAVDVDGNETNRHKKNLDTLEIKLILTGGFHEIKPPKFTISSFFTRKHVV